MPGLTSRPARRLARRIKLIQALCAVLRERPLIVVIALLTFAALLAAGLAGVFAAAAAAVGTAKDLAEHGLGNQVALSFREAMLIGSFGSELLAVVVKQRPRCADLEAQWEQIAADVMERVDPAIVKQLELAPAAVVWKTYPPLYGEVADYVYGRDLLKEPSDRPGTLLILQSRQTIIMGPYNCAEDFTCAFVVTPISLPAPSKEYDWGCGHQPYNCPEGLCWNATSKTKFWGQVSTMLDLDPLLTGNDLRLRFLEQHGYRYKLWQANTTLANPYFVLGTTSPPPVDTVVLEIAAYNVKWYLELSPARGWVPPWRDPCLAGVVVGSACVGLLVLWLLVSREQHDRLLRAMLPPKVIKQLQSGETAIAQEYEHVTILFSDIVGYTCVASQLSPRQVVVLLNELFSVFDELTHHNGVYKVETIGDALMCVSGAPVPDDPVRSAVRMAHMALDMLAAVEQFRPSLEGVRVQIRVGVHSGPVVAGVVGRKMPRYCLFGDTVNTASRMESTSVPMHIQVSAATAALLRASEEGFILEPRGSIDVKGKGSMDTFWLRGGPQPSCRSQLLASLHRPPSLVIRPPPPPPPHPHRALTRTMTAPCAAGGNGFGGGIGSGAGGSPALSAALDTAISLPCFSEGPTESFARMHAPRASLPSVPATLPPHQPREGPGAAGRVGADVHVPARAGAVNADARGSLAGNGGYGERNGTSSGDAAHAEAGAGAAEAAEVMVELMPSLQSVGLTAQLPAFGSRGSGVPVVGSPLRWQTSPRSEQQQPQQAQPQQRLQQQPPSKHSLRRHSVSSSFTWGGGGGGPLPPSPTLLPAPAGRDGGSSAAAAILSRKVLGGSANPLSPFTRPLAAAAVAAAAAATRAGSTGAGSSGAAAAAGQLSSGHSAVSRYSPRSVSGMYDVALRAGSSGGVGSGGVGGSGSSGRLEMARRALTRRLSMSRPEELSHLMVTTVSDSRPQLLPAHATEPGQVEGRVLFRWMSRDRSSAGSGAFTALQEGAEVAAADTVPAAAATAAAAAAAVAEAMEK